MQGLTAASNFLRHAVAESMSLRHTPELSFVLDHSDRQAGRVDELLQRLHKAKK